MNMLNTNRYFICFCLLISFFFITGFDTRVDYPRSKTVDVFDTYHGQVVTDPYRWLEDLDSEETQSWIKTQNQFTDQYLTNLPEIEAIKTILDKALDQATQSVPFREQSKYFYYYNNGDWQQSKLYYKENNQGREKLVLDPNQFSEDGTVALSGVSVSSDAKLLAYAISDGGSDWKTWKIRNLETGLDLEEAILWSKFSGAEWLKDNSGFYYSAYSKPQAGAELEDVNTNQKLYLHKIGEQQSSDQLIYARPDKPDWGWGPTVSEDGNYLILHVSQGTDERNRIFYQNLNDSNDAFVELIPELKAQFHFVGNKGNVFWFFTNLNAPMGRLIAIDISHPKEENWQEIIPEQNNALREVHLTSGYFLCHYLKDVSSEVVLYRINGEQIKKLDFPKNGTISNISTKPDSSQLFFSFSNYIRPQEIFEYDLSIKQLKSIWSQSVPGFNADEFTSTQAFYKSKDGTLIPMFISHLNGIKLNNDNPLLLYGYGGFDIPILPNFSTKYFSWMKMGGIVAVANLRGGGEYGEKWHRQGMLHNKQNVFDDFAAAAEYLHQQGYSQPSKTVIEGRSNGGLLVGASLLQRPELFGATLPGVGVMDMLRFNKFTIGWAWESDYGSPENADDFKVLIKYSPYHNIKAKTCYPPTLITTSARDDRVVPSHSYKFAARMQAAQSCQNPILIRIESRAGHGAGTPKDKVISYISDMYGFALNTLTSN